MSDLVMAGLQLMLIGMGTVFTFLTLLVFCSMLMSRVILRFSPQVVNSDEDQARLISVISAAIASHRNR